MRRSESTSALDNRRDRAARFKAALLECGKQHTMPDRHTFTAKHPIVSVRDVATGLLVAYSCSSADFDQALDEFIWDFL